MKVYTGAVGSLEMLEEMKRLAVGRCVSPVYRRSDGVVMAAWKTPKPGVNWFLDNGAFATRGTPFRREEWWRVVELFSTYYTYLGPLPDGWGVPWFPDFGVIPDIVGGGVASLNFSVDQNERLFYNRQWPWYLVVQPGMTVKDVERVWEYCLEDSNPFGGVFVGGGDSSWKVKTGRDWVRFARERGVPCHLGGEGTQRVFLWAARAGFDSIDSTRWGRTDALHEIVQARDAIKTQSTIIA